MPADRAKGGEDGGGPVRPNPSSEGWGISTPACFDLLPWTLFRDLAWIRLPWESCSAPGRAGITTTPGPKDLPVYRRLVGSGFIVFGLVVLALGCNSDDSDSFPITGTWEGSVPEADAEFTMLLSKQGKDGIGGTAQVTAPPAGQVPGTVSGTLDGADVTLTISVDEVMLGGSVVFEGAFQSDDVMSGTVDSGILGGTFPITFQRQVSS